MTPPLAFCTYEHSAPSHYAEPEADLCLRILAEFREMPGLRLTLSQASRLFNIEANRCERVLGALVRSGSLANDGKRFSSPRDRRCA